MDKAYFLEDTTSKQQEDLPYDDGFSQVKIYHGYNLTSRYDIPDVSNQMNLTEDESQEKATYKETCQEADMTMTLDKTTENAVSKTCDKENQCTINLPIPANQEDTSKSNISDVLLHHLCKEEISKDQGIDCETLPEISNNDSFDEAIIKNIIVWHVKNSWPTEQSSELTDQLNSKSDDENSNKPSCSLTMTEENTSDSDELVAAGESNHEENSNFLTKIRSLHDKQKSCLCQTPQKQAEKVSSGDKFKYGHSQVYYWFSDFSKVAPKVKIPKNNIIDKPLITDPQASFSPKLREKSAVGQDISEITSRSNYVEKQEQTWETTEPSQRVKMEPTVHIHQEHLAGIESEPNLSKLPSTSKEDPSLSSSYIFQKISQGKEMCQKLKEQTDQLKAKVQEFSKRIAQDSPYHFQHRRLVLEKLQGRLELLEQEFLANKEKHLTLKEQVHRHESRAVNDSDPERKVEGEIFKLEMLLKDFKEKINKSKCTSAVSLLVNSPINLDDLSFTSSPPSNEGSQARVRERGQDAPPHGHRRPPLLRSWPHSPSKECSDGLLLRVQEGEVDGGFHGSLAAQVGGKPFAQRRLGEGGRNLPEAPVLDQRLSPTAACRGLTCGFYCNAGFDSVDLGINISTNVCKTTVNVFKADNLENTQSKQCSLLRSLSYKVALTQSGGVRTRAGLRPGSRGVSQILGRIHICVCFLVQEKPSTASGRQDRAETTSASCAFCLRLLPWKQKTGKKDHRGIDCGGFPIAIQDKVLHPDSVLGSDRGHSCCCASRIGLQSSKCENCGTKIHNSQRGCSKESPKEFHYRYNTPGQNFFNHRERSAFARLHYLNENNSSPTHSEQKWICFQRANPKSCNDGCEPIPRKSDLATLSPHSHSCRISENTSSSNFSRNKETESEILNSSLDHALRTATILKQTTDQMIRTIAEDLAKVQRWRKKLKY
ncbi:protein AKNAD1 [Cervus elaphus]|uniref:protein AKNAD1 n=1 Tax=Cervus elaphus TaxID=9860 RepID=UPI001CC28809|nr:protein AKNAD1 [Cervus elaphus]